MSDFESKVRIDIDASQALAQIKLLQRQISDFHSSMAKGSATANLKSLQMQQSLVDTINATGQYSAQMKTVASSTQAFTTSLEKNKLSLNQYFKYAGGASRSFGKFFKTEMDTIQKVAIERVKDLQTQYIKMGRDANGALKTIAVRPLALDMENLSTKTQIAAQKQQLLNQLLKQGSTNLLNFGKNTQWAGRQLMVGFSIPLGILGATAAKTFMEMEKQAVSFKRVYGDTFTPSAETDKMLKQVKDLASEFTKYGVTVEKTMESAAKAAATGKMGADLLAQVSESTRLSVLGNVDQQKALETTISLTNAFGTSADELRGKINFLNAVENQTVTSIEDLTIAIPKAAPVIKQLGGNVEDLSFFLTAMREGGINASEGANALKSGLASLINPTNKASKMLEGFGINIQSIVQKNKGDVKGLVIDFAKALDTLDPLNRARAIEQLFGKFQFSRLSTLFQNVIKQGSQASKVLELTKQSSAELGILAQKELNRISSSPMYKFQKAVADFKKELAPVGEEFIKAITPLIQFGTDVLKAFNNLDGGVKQFIITTTGVIAGLGPIMLMTFGLIANGVANITKGFSFVKSIFNKTTTASQVLGETTDYMTQQQIESAAVAASLDQVHNKLTQSFTVEAKAVANLAAQYEKAISAQVAFSGVPARGGKAKAAPKKYASGIFSVPGPKGAGDIVPAMLAPGEAVIPAGPAQKYRGFIKGMIAGKIPGFANGKVGTDNIDWSNFSKAERDSLTKKLRSAPDALKAEKDAMTWTTKNKEIELIKKRLQELGKTQTVIDRYTQTHASHLKPSKVSRNIGGRSFAMSDFSNASNLTPDVGLINQFTQQISQRVAKGEITAKQIKSIVGKSMTTAEIQDQLKRLAAGEHISATPAGNKVLNAVAQHASSGAMKLGVGTRDIAPIVAEVTKMRTADTSSKGFLKGIGQRKFSQNTLARGQVQIESTLKGIYNKAKKMLSDPEYRAAQTANKKAFAAESQSAQQRTTTAKTEKKTSVAKNEAAKAEKKAAVAKSQAAKTEEKDAKKKAAVKVNATPTTSVTEQLGNGVTRITNSDGKVQYKIGGRYANAEKAQSLINETTASKKSTRRGRAGSFLSRRGALGGLGMAASMGGSMMGGDIGNTIANVGNAAFIADVGRSFIPAGAKAKLATFGVEKLLPTLTKLAPMFLKLTVVLGVATTAYEIFTASARKQAEISKAVVDTLSMSKDKLDKVNEFFGTNAQLSGIRTLSVAGEGQTGKQASLAEQFRTSDQFKSLYGDQANQLRGATDKQFAITMQSLALDLYGQGVGAEQVQIIVDAIKKEAQKTNVVIKFKDLTLDTETGRQNLAKSIKEITDGMVTELKSQRDWLGLNWLASANIDAYTSQLSGFISALSQEFEKGRISVTEFQTSFSKIEASFYQAEKANPGDGISYLNDVLQKTSPEVAFASAGIADFNNLLMVTKLAAKGAAMSTQLLADVAAGDINAIDYLHNLNKLEDKKNSDMIKVQKVITGITNQQKNLQKQETAVNDLYDKRITALERIDSLNQSISDRQKGQLDLADALSQGDVFRAAQAMQQIRADEAKVALEQQKNSLQDARDKQTGAIQNKQDNLDSALTSAQSKLNDISNTQMDPYNSKINSTTMEQLFNTYGWMYKLLNANLWFADSDTVKKEFGKYVSGNSTVTNTEDPLGMFKGKKGNVLPNGFGPGHATGGHITGPGSGTSDSIPAMLSNGEYVVRANAVKAIGVDALDKLNHAEKFADGGKVGKSKNNGSSININNPQSILSAGLNSVMDGIYQNLFGGWMNNLRHGNPTAPTAEDALIMGLNAAPIPGFKGIKAGAAGIKGLLKTGTAAGAKAAYGTKMAEMVAASSAKAAQKAVTKTFNPSKPATGGEYLKALKIEGFTNFPAGKKYDSPLWNAARSKFGDIPSDISVRATPFTLAKTGIGFSQSKLAGLQATEAGVKYALRNGVSNFNEGILSHPDFPQWQQAGLSKDHLNNLVPWKLGSPDFNLGEFLRQSLQAKNQAKNSLAGANDLLNSKSPYLALQKMLWSMHETRIDKKLAQGLGFNMPSKTLAKLISVLPPNIAALFFNKTARHRSDSIIQELYHPQDIPIENGQVYGPGTYFAQTPEISDMMFNGFGNQVHGMTVTPKAAIKTLFGKGYIDSNKLAKEYIKIHGTQSGIQKQANISGNQWRTHVGNQLDQMPWNDKLIQGLLSKGYIGYKHGDALTNWLVGVPNSGYGLKHIESNLGKSITMKKGTSNPMLKYMQNMFGNQLGITRNQNVPLLDMISQFLNGKVKPKTSGFNSMEGLANGGLVNIPHFKNGGMFRTGYAGGGLAKLHDKEFVMNPGAVREYGVGNLKAMNNGTYNSGSVYNSYGVNINVGGSNSNASDIARTVIKEIKKIDSQQIRSTRI